MTHEESKIDELLNELSLLNGLTFLNIYPELTERICSKNTQFIEIIKLIFFNNNKIDSSKTDFFLDGKIGVIAAPIIRNEGFNYYCNDSIILNSILIDCPFDQSWLYNSNLVFVFFERLNYKNAIEWPIIISGSYSLSEEEKFNISLEWDLLFQKLNKNIAILGNENRYVTVRKGTDSSTGPILVFKPYLINKIYSKIQRLNTKKRLEDLLLTPPKNNYFQEGLESYLQNRFRFFVNNTPEQIANELNVNYNSNSKQALSVLSRTLLAIESNYDIEVFIKSGLIAKTIRVKSNGKPYESISFPSFKYNDFLIQNWEDSDLFDILYVTKFLFIIYQYEENIESSKLIFKGTFIKSFSNEEINIAREAWEMTKDIILSGNIVKEIKGNIRYTNFPGSKDNEIVHVRPHATTSDDVYPLPIKDKITQASNYTKHSFWLNQAYLQKIINQNFKL
jgi:hypothetical protein